MDMREQINHDQFNMILSTARQKILNRTVSTASEKEEEKYIFEQRLAAIFEGGSRGEKVTID